VNEKKEESVEDEKNSSKEKSNSEGSREETSSKEIVGGKDKSDDDGSGNGSKDEIVQDTEVEPEVAAVGSVAELKKRLKDEGAGEKHHEAGRKKWSERQPRVIESLLLGIRKSEKSSVLAMDVLLALYSNQSWALNFKAKRSTLEEIFLGDKPVPSSPFSEEFEFELEGLFVPSKMDEVKIFRENLRHLPHVLELVKLASDEESRNWGDEMTPLEKKSAFFDVWIKYARAYLIQEKKEPKGSEVQDLASLIEKAFAKVKPGPNATVLASASIWFVTLMRESADELEQIKKRIHSAEAEVRVERDARETSERHQQEIEGKLLELEDELKTAKDTIERLEKFIENEKLKTNREQEAKLSLFANHVKNEFSPMIENLEGFNRSDEPDKEIIQMQLDKIRGRIDGLKDWRPQ